MQLRTIDYSNAKEILKIEDLRVSFNTYVGEVKAIRGVDITLYEGEILAVVGESGCGKSVSFQSVIKLLDSPPAEYKGGKILYQGKNLLEVSKKEMQDIRGSEISMIMQDPMTALDPTMQIGNQISEGLRRHNKGMSKAEAEQRVVKMLELVGIPDPDKRLKQYPHEFSGGMRQRVCAAMALVSSPKILIADEPTTALDVTIQAQIMDLLHDLRKKLNTAIVLITHDLGVVADMADRIVVMYAGKVVETGQVEEIFYDSWHPYTWGLMRSMPKLNETSKVELATINGMPPDLFMPPQGCAFAPRCEYAMKVCYEEQPPVFPCGSDSHCSACWLMDPDAPKVKQPFKKDGEE